jgi:hypothetical protein
MAANADYDDVIHYCCVVGYRSRTHDVQVKIGMITGDRERRFAHDRRSGTGSRQ